MFSLVTKLLLACLVVVGILIILGTHTLEYASPEHIRTLAFSILPTAIKTSTDATNGYMVEGMNTQHSEPSKESVHSAKPSEDLKVTNKDSFCTSTANDKSELERKCGKLTKANCKDIKCCVLLNGAKCVTGDVHGPTFESDHKSEKTGDDYWYYKGECYGKSCPK